MKIQEDKGLTMENIFSQEKVIVIDFGGQYTSIIVAVAISLPYLRQKAAFMKTKRAAMAKRKQGGNL